MSSSHGRPGSARAQALDYAGKPFIFSILAVTRVVCLFCVKVPLANG
jgi:hypothetical protein